MSTNFNIGGGPGQGPFGQLLKVLGALLALAAAFMFSLVFFAVLAIAGLILWLYLWWKTRAVRRQMREHLAAAQSRDPGFGPATSDPAPASGEVIEGEAVRVIDEGKRLGD